jgi:formylglycine-generating enzyme required for sulfatase activity
LTAKDSERNKSIDAILNHDVICEGNFVIDGFFYPGPADLRSRKLRLNAKDALHLDDFGISWMDDNVSEWMQEIYKDNWLPMYTKQRQALEQSGKEEDKISALVEDYFNKRNAVNGQLVRGGNFWDERFSDIEKKNLAGIMLKRFVSPDEAHATIGFRYVVRVEKK